MKLFRNSRAYENAHIALWLLKDTSWVNTWRWFGTLMIVPTLAVALDLAWRSRRDVHEVMHNLAICLWITANAVWMLGEFYAGDAWRPVARIFFFSGLVLMAVYYGAFFKDHRAEGA